MNALQYLEQQAKIHNFYVCKSFDQDYNLHPDKDKATVKDLIELWANLDACKYTLLPEAGNPITIHVHAPFRNEHAWDDRGWNHEILISMDA